MNIQVLAGFAACGASRRRKCLAKRYAPRGRGDKDFLGSLFVRALSARADMPLFRQADGRYLMYGSSSLNCGVPEQRSSSYIIISVEEMTAPAARMRSSPIFQFHSERAPTASEATWTRYPSLSAPSAVWVTQMCASMPHNSRVLRLPGSCLILERNSSLPKQLNSSLSMVLASPSDHAISVTVAPSPLLYCVVTRAGMDSIFASRISNCAFLTMVSLLKIGGNSFSWMSTTIKAHCAAPSGRRAASKESGAMVLMNDDIKSCSTA